jgi:hypothetical protein
MRAVVDEGVSGRSGLHFLQVSLTQTFLQTYLPAELSHADYPALIAANEKILTHAGCRCDGHVRLGSATLMR